MLEHRQATDGCSKAELGSSMLAISSMFRPPVCTRWWWWPQGSRWGCMRTLSLVSRAMWLSQLESRCTFGVLLVTFGGPRGRWELKR